MTFETDNVRTRITFELEAEPKEKLPPGRRWWLRRKLGESLAADAAAVRLRARGRGSLGSGAMFVFKAAVVGAGAVGGEIAR